MWTSFVFDDVGYLSQLDVTESDSITIYVTDFKKIWMQKQDAAVFIRTFKDLNPCIEVDIMEATEKLRQFLNKCSIAEREENLDVHVEGLLGEYTITYKFVLEKGSSDMFYSKLTVPLLHSLLQLQHQKDVLCTKLEAKDKEIKQHVFEKGDIKRSDLKTEEFDVNKMNEDNNDLFIPKSLTNSKEFSSILFKSLGISNNNALLQELAKQIKPKKTLKRCKPKKCAGLMKFT